MNTVEGVQLTQLREINGEHGSVIHGLRVSDEGYVDFGEVYFSTVNYKSIKGWKKHHRMTLNLIVISGGLTLVVDEDRVSSKTFGNFFEITLSADEHKRLTVPFGIWMAFRGMSKNNNKLINIASLAHDPTEQENIPLNQINYMWREM